MTNKDDPLWTAYAQTVTPAPKKTRKPVVAKSTPAKAAARKAAEKPPPVWPQLTATPLKTADSLERNREKALRQGAIDIEAKLDLHGMTQTQAFAALASFMQQKSKAGNRHLLIITGKGRDGSGVLRAQLKNWLGQLPQAPAILAIRPAAPHHGGAGAFYILLRKARAH